MRYNDISNVRKVATSSLVTNLNAQYINGRILNNIPYTSSYSNTIDFKSVTDTNSFYKYLESHNAFAVGTYIIKLPHDYKYDGYIEDCPLGTLHLNGATIMVFSNWAGNSHTIIFYLGRKVQVDPKFNFKIIKYTYLYDGVSTQRDWSYLIDNNDIANYVTKEEFENFKSQISK